MFMLNKLNAGTRARRAQTGCVDLLPDCEGSTPVERCFFK